MTTASDVIAVARAEVGYHEGRNADGHWNNHQKYSPAVPGLEWSDWQAWCATFVSWCAMTAGAGALFPRTASCATGVQWFRGRGRFSEYPAIGAQVFYGPGGGSHTGIVYAYDDTYLYSCEGNTNQGGSAEGDGVYLKKRLRRDPYVYGYGYPNYPGGIVSADPAWRSQTPKPTPPPQPTVSLARILAAARADIPAATGHQTYPADVRLVETALAAEGFMSGGYSRDGSWGTTTRTAYAAWQRRCGYSGRDADGTPGMTSLRKLGEKHGFGVTA